MGWGILGKIDDAVKAVGEAVGSRAGAAKDAVKEIVVDGEVGLLHDTFVQPWQQAGDGHTSWYQAIGHGLASDAGDVGHLFGGAFHLVEAPFIGREGVKDVDAKIATAYREGVDQPVATLFTAASLAESEKYQGTSKDNFSAGRIFKGKLWKDAYRITQDKDRSLGQAFALMGSDDVADEAKVEQYQQGTLYKITAGALDATAPFLLDPLLPVAKAGNLARARYVTKPIRAGDDITQIAASKRVQEVVEDIHGMDAAQIRHKYGFSPQLSVLLETGGSKDAKTTILRHAMGDMGAINDLDGMGSIADRSTYLQNALNRAMGNRDALRAAGFTTDGWTAKFDESGNLANHDDWHLSAAGNEQLKKVSQEISDLEGEQYLLSRWQDVHRELENVPHKTRTNDLRYAVTRSEWYQGRNGAPLRVIFQMRPHTFLNLDDPVGDVQVHRLLSHSSLDNASREQFRGQYLRATNGQERLEVLHSAEDAAVNSILDRHGYDDLAKKRILSLASEGRGQLQTALKQRETNFDGQGRDRVTLPSGEVTHLPLSVSQNQNVAALVDLDKVEALAKRYSPERARKLGLEEGGTGMDRLARLGETGEDTLQLFYRYWKPSVLLRIAYPLRVALGEEQLRIAAMFGALSQAKYLRSGFANNREDAAIIDGRIEARISADEAKKGSRLTPRERVAVSREVEKDYNQNERTRGYRNVEYDGYQISPAFGGSGRKMATLNSSRASYDRNMGRDANLIAGALAKELRGFKGTGDFVGGVTWKDADRNAQAQWHKAYLDATMRHLGHDAVARKIIAQHLDPRIPVSPNGEIKNWLNTAEGSKYRSELDRTRRANMDDWLDSLRDQIESYLPTPALKQAALDKNLTLDLVGKEFANRPRPVVHGEILAAHVGLSALGSAIDRVVDRMYQALASGPTDVLSRHPAFNHTYTREVARQIDLAHGQAARRGVEDFRITQDELSHIENQARQKSLRVVKKNLYDIAETSDLGHALRYVSPFFNAWQEVLTVWAGISKENFRVPVQLHNAWDAPDRAGLTYTDPNGNEYLTLPVPKYVRDHFPGGALKDVDHLMMSKRGLNLIMTGLPGVGPVVGIPTAVLLKDRPDLASSGIIKMLYPYGAPTKISDAFTPTTIRNLVNANQDFDNATFKRIYVGIYNKQMVDYSLGKRTTRPDPKQIEAEAHAQSNLRSFLQFVLPSAPKFDTPYQPFLDTYQNLLREDPEHADERFYDQYPDYFQLTTHMSKSINGVPPTLEAWKASQKQKDLIAEHPELGAMILGDIPGSEFNSAVYNYQRNHRVGPGDEREQRVSLGVQDIVNGPTVRAGWLEYHKNMTIIEDELERRGLKDFSAHGAEDLKALKKHTIEWMSAQPQFQGWYDEFGKRDARKWDKRINAMTEIANAPSLTGRTDIAGLREYLDDRKVITDELARRKAQGLPGSLDAHANAGLLGLWKSAVTQLTLGNPAFAALAHRYLDNDTLEVA